jgi:DNA modification methylase/DNA-directed RNA polymerase subunit M/transcription elongation factor TFIIS
MSSTKFFGKELEEKGKAEVRCLGMKFNTEEDRREYFRKILREKLPELKKMDGFPIGEDEDIIALSDPPYYTACPNPWLNDFAKEWEKEKETIPGRKKEFYVDEPYASDVSEGKSNPVYNAHSYHTKVPHPAIMRYILHYTQPGDIIFDGFAGTGMTGVAAQVCGNTDQETKVKIENEWKELYGSKPVWGPRKAILGDLSPVASFIAYNYNTPVNVRAFEKEAKQILSEVEEEYGWMYTTLHCPALFNAEAAKQKDRIAELKKQLETVEEIIIDKLHRSENPKAVLVQEVINESCKKAGLPEGFVQKGTINYTVWSDVFICPNCGNEIVFWETAVNHEEGKVNEEFYCMKCNHLTSKRKVDKYWMTLFDKALNATIRQTKTVPVMINYTSGKTRTSKLISKFDEVLIERIDRIEIPYWFPTDALPKGDKTSDPFGKGITHVHHFYTKRNLHMLAALRSKCNTSQTMLLFNTQLINISKLNRYRIGVSFPYNPLNGTLYIGSQISESNIFVAYSNKIEKLNKAFTNTEYLQTININSANQYPCLPDNTGDYIFTDPPFGANLMYSELNFIWESWLKVKTNNKTEAIANKTQNKTLQEYHNLMTECFREYYRILKPGKWMTVEFSNTSAAVWNGIQNSIQRAGFVIANVAALDKQLGSFNAVTTLTAVKQDLVISCYKPSSEFENKFSSQPVETSIWEFVSEHLKHLPVHMAKSKKTTAVIERSPRIIYDRVIKYYLMHGMNVPVDSADFQEVLKRKFRESDGMIFLPEQLAEYEEQKQIHGNPEQFSLIFDIYSESEAIQWLKNRLADNPQTYQDIMPDFRKANAATRKGELQLELKTLLEENFIQNGSGAWRIPDMNESKDREAIRKKALLKEFDSYKDALSNGKAKRLKEVRAEALYTGFKECWEKKDFATIILVGENIPQNILLEDEQLLMYFDIAKDRA